jgi:two-component system nitrogen regulation sensor histidine kinase NtrY
MTSAASVEQAATADVAGTAPTSGRSMRVVGAIAAALSLLSAFMTFVVLADLTPVAPTHRVVVTLLLINAATVLILLGVIAREVWLVVLARRRGRAAARLHVRIVGLFSVIAAVPAILVAIVASVTLDRGLDRLFSTRTKSVIENSMYVANAYLREHAQTIRGDIMAMAIDLGRAKSMFDQDRDRFRQFMTAQAKVRGLSSAILVDDNTKVIERADVKAEHESIMPSQAGLASTTENEPRIGIVFEASAVASMVKLRGYENLYLHVTRPLDPRVVAQLRETQASVSDFASLEARRLGVQLAFALMYTVIALTVLLSAAWLGLNFANRLVAPIRRLIGAANIVSTGNLYIQVPIQRSEGDLAHLGETFNKMTYELRTQRDDIVRARDLIDQRRRFTEAVLAGASAGVIGVDAEGRISILNRSAERLIGQSQTEAAGRLLTDIVPELKAIYANAQSGLQRLVQDQVTISREGRDRNLQVRVTTEQ